MQKLIQIRQSRQIKIQHNKTTLVQSPLTALGQETRWAYSTMIPDLGPETHTGPNQLPLPRL